MSKHDFNNTNVLHLEASDFSGKTLTVNGQKLPGITVVFTYASYCGHCLNAMPEIIKLAKKYNKSHVNDKSVTVACVQGDGNDRKPLTILGSIVDIPGYPTFLVFKNGEFVATYNGARTLEGIESHLKTI